ncbi:hypothetical protein B6D29_03850 [Microgenomates bacterium UTCPR1]|nr:NYN domain-containing protein [Patescibacteria group bacterium]OQY65468.1 MAG: hypothetical protein B6D29_03850 [Microgenomates bacterium UTCPR1]
MNTYCFIDAANLFYGGEKSLGWKIDYKKLKNYIKKKYNVKKIFYYAGIELNGFPYSVLDNQPLNLTNLINYLKNKKMIKNNVIQRAKFYLKLLSFGYNLKLKPVKIFKEKNSTIKKANCDVDMTFDLMRYLKEYSSALILSGDGDFAPVIKYIKRLNRKVIILSRGERTAKEIRQLAGKDFRDFNYLRELIGYK